MPDTPEARMNAPKPRVTVVMTARERYRLSLVAIESILANTALPLRFIFAHGRLPAWLDEAVARLARAGRIESRPFDTAFWPQQMRKALIGEIDTEYVVFIDNDVLMSPAWLERLVECADESGAGAVGPLYLWGDGVGSARVHMAGGQLNVATLPEGTLMEEVHAHLDAELAAVRGQLARGPCDFVEFHCMLVRTALARREGVLDDAIACVHEHIDIALSLRALGGATYFEPAAQATYLAFVPHVLEDLPMMRSRWDLGAMEASIAAFCAKWKVLADDRAFAGVRSYVGGLRGHNDPLRLDTAADDLALPLAAHDLPQTRSTLLALAGARGYGAPQVAFLAQAYRVAEALFDGGYRPCGRPFIQHLVGTAGALLRYDFCIEVVIEGLLHAAYTHRRVPAAQIEAMLAGLHALVDKRVRDYTQRVARPAAPSAGECSIRDAEVAALEAANEIDMRLSGEYDYSGRPAEIGPERVARLSQVLGLLGVSGMAATLQSAIAAARPAPPELVTGLKASYRIGPGNRMVPMAGGSPETPARVPATTPQQ